MSMANGRPVAAEARLPARIPKGAWIRVKEVFGGRHFATRRELAGGLGLVPTPQQRCTVADKRGGVRRVWKITQ